MRKENLYENPTASPSEPKEKRRWIPRELLAAVVLLAVAIVAVKLFFPGSKPVAEPVQLRPVQTVAEPVEGTETIPTEAPTEPEAETTFPQETEPETEPEPEPEPTADPGQWQDNVLTQNPLNALVQKRSLIVEVIFHDDLSQAPAFYSRVNLGVNSSDCVVGWVEQEGYYCILHIAAEGGMSGELCTANLFMNCINLRSVSFNGAFHTENATSFRNMFYGCKSLKSVDAQTLDTASVTNMEHTFRYCIALGAPDLTGWDFDNVTAYENFLDEDIRINGEPWTALFE